VLNYVDLKVGCLIANPAALFLRDIESEASRIRLSKNEPLLFIAFKTVYDSYYTAYVLTSQGFGTVILYHDTYVVFDFQC